MRRRALLAAIVLAVPSPSVGSDVTALELAERFCAAMVDGTIDPLSLASPSLAEAISEAMAQNDAIQAETPDEKPPLGDGIPWSSWPDKPDSCLPVTAEEKSIFTRVIVEYGFAAAPTANYRDVLIVVPHRPDPGQAMQWRLDDVEMQGGVTLRAALQQAFSD